MEKEKKNYGNKEKEELSVSGGIKKHTLCQPKRRSFPAFSPSCLPACHFACHCARRK
jgi:hypothetical protein